MPSSFASRASRYVFRTQSKIRKRLEAQISYRITPPIWRHQSSCRETHRYFSTTFRQLHEASRSLGSGLQKQGTIPRKPTEELEYPISLQEIDPKSVLSPWEKAPESQKISLRPLFVAIAICFGCFCVADVLDRMSDADFLRILQQTSWKSRDGLLSATRQVQRVKCNQTLAWLEQIHASSVITQVGDSVLSWWYSLDDARSAAVMIIAINTVVFLAWQSKSPRVLRRMARSFIHFPGRTSSYTLLTSVFSHHSFMHLAFNMLALYGFAHMSFSYLKFHRINDYPNLDNGVTMNITSRYQFIAMFMSLGVIANLIPHYVTLLAVRSPALMSSSLGPALTPQGGLGASGAVYGCMAITALAHPDIQISLIFLPMLPFKISYGFPAVCAIDAIGVLRGWTRFGHAVHLTGAAAGAGAFVCGPAAWYWGQQVLHGGRIQPNSQHR